MTAQTNDPWTEYMTPSAVHQQLQKYTGNFQMEITMGSGEKASVISVASENKMLLGGRFLEMKQTGIMMGMDYESITTVGFNNTDQIFSLTTITNMGTGTLNLVGKWKDKYKSAVLYGTLMNPVTKTNIEVKQVLTFIDEDTILIESFDKEGNAPEKKTVIYKLMRQK